MDDLLLPFELEAEATDRLERGRDWGTSVDGDVEDIAGRGDLFGTGAGRGPGGGDEAGTAVFMARWSAASSRGEVHGVDGTVARV
ncbi:hypothetical protein [Actinomadura soli]|uniref:hypothetical protein n=1 Tax=Actinomadura soli TaxID=2508997 RepID=UPI00197ADFA9|nr:hypothetical protein [Actinomadura soli]